MKNITFRFMALAAMLAFAITLAVIIGQRMSAEAMAVLMGVVAGVAASIPTSIIVVWIAAKVMIKQPAQPESPRIMVVPSPAPTPPQPTPAYGYPSPYGGWAQGPAYPAVAAPSMVIPPMQRKFTVIGGGDLDEGLETE
jgi:hypothetical protein